jgi:hypothetical protein
MVRDTWHWNPFAASACIGCLVVVACVSLAPGQPLGGNLLAWPAAKSGVSVNEEKAMKGYTLVAPLNSTKAYSTDIEGRMVKIWETIFTVARPAEQVARINEFLSGQLNVEAACAVVDPRLDRNLKVVADSSIG